MNGTIKQYFGQWNDNEDKCQVSFREIPRPKTESGISMETWVVAEIHSPYYLGFSNFIKEKFMPLFKILNPLPSSLSPCGHRSSFRPFHFPSSLVPPPPMS